MRTTRTTKAISVALLVSLVATPGALAGAVLPDLGPAFEQKEWREAELIRLGNPVPSSVGDPGGDGGPIWPCPDPSPIGTIICAIAPLVEVIVGAVIDQVNIVLVTGSAVAGEAVLRGNAIVDIVELGVNAAGTQAFVTVGVVQREAGTYYGIADATAVQVRDQGVIFANFALASTKQACYDTSPNPTDGPVCGALPGALP